MSWDRLEGGRSQHRVESTAYECSSMLRSVRYEYTEGCWNNPLAGDISTHARALQICQAADLPIFRAVRLHTVNPTQHLQPYIPAAQAPFSSTSPLCSSRIKGSITASASEVMVSHPSVPEEGASCADQAYSE